MKRVICFGDSNTFGYDPRSYLGSQYPADVCWTGLLKGMGWEVVNCGQNGLRIPRESQFPAIIDLLCRSGAADVVAVMLGGNDLLNGMSAEETAARMEALLRFMKEHKGDVVLLLIAPPPLRFGDWVQTRELIDESKRLGGLYRQLAGKLDIALADAGDWDVSLTFDGVHFSPEGHAAFAKGLAQVLETIGQEET